VFVGYAMPSVVWGSLPAPGTDPVKRDTPKTGSTCSMNLDLFGVHGSPVALVADPAG